MHLHIKILLILLAVHTATEAEITVTEPSSPAMRVAEGREYSVYEIGNAWDMDSSADIDVNESVNLSNLSFQGGVLSYDVLEGPNILWLVFPGRQMAFRGLDRGERFPMDTSVYRFLTIKLRMRDLEGDPLTTDQPFIVRFFEDATRLPADAGILKPRSDTYEDWTVIEWDLADAGDHDVNTNYFWSDLAAVRGLRFNPIRPSESGVTVEIDWVRLSAGPAAGTEGTVSWEDDSGAGPYDVFVTDGDFTFTVASGVTGTTVNADLSRLPAGDYMVGVTDGISTEFSPGSFAVNQTPLLNFTTPSRKGDQARGYGIEQTGNGWNSIDAGDIAATPDLSMVRYDDPPGSLSARPTSSDPRILFNTTAAIDTSIYRMLCYTFQVSGPRDIGTGSVARILWGNNLPTLATSDDVVIGEGLNEYCIGDLTDMPTENPGDDWSGSVDFIRFDPHEFPVSSECAGAPSPENCRDVRLDSFILAPFHRSVGAITLAWDDSDADDDAMIGLFHDLDQDPANGNEGTIVEDLPQSDAGGQWTWNTGAVPAGTYYIFGIIDDGRNATLRYSSGPVEVISDVVFANGFE